MTEKMEIDPFCKCTDCDHVFCWQEQGDKHKDIYKVTKRKLEAIRCPVCEVSGDNIQLTIKRMDA